MVRSGIERRVAVVGGGVTGLATSYYLGKAGVPVDLFEAEEETGGLARSFNLDGLKVERYYHFICGPDTELIDLAHELGLGDMLVWRRTRTSFFYQGRLYPFATPLDLLRFSPITLWQRLNFGLETLKWRRMSNWENLDGIAGREWLISQLGKQTYDVIWHPLLSMKFGEYRDRVSAAWVWHRVHRVASSRKSPFCPEMMGHFQGGTETLFTRLRERITEHGSRIHCRAPVQKVLQESAGRVRGVHVLGMEREYDAVVLAVPLPQSAALLPFELEEYRVQLERVPFLGVVCLVLWMNTTLCDSFWCNVYDDRIPFNGIIEMTQLNPEAGRGGSLMYVPFYLPVHDPRFTASDEDLLEEFLQAAPMIRPGVDRSAIRASWVFRSRLAQAVCEVGFRHIQPSHAAPLKGLFLLDSTHLYPSDRTVSGMIGLAQTVSRMVLGQIDRRER